MMLKMLGGAGRPSHFSCWRHCFLLSTFLLVLILHSAESFDKSYSSGELTILKLKLPSQTFSKYLEIVKEYSQVSRPEEHLLTDEDVLMKLIDLSFHFQFIDILNEPRITADTIKLNESVSHHPDVLYAQWLVKSHFICEYIQTVLSKSGIFYSVSPVKMDAENLSSSSSVLNRRKRNIDNQEADNNSSTRLADNELKSINGSNFMTQYHSFEQIIQWCYRVEKTYPTIASTIEIGKSVQGRSLLVLKLGYPSRNHRTKRSFWFDSGIHAREWTTISTAMYSIDKILAEQNTTNSMMHRFLTKYDIYFLLVTNPDGYTYSQNVDVFWRKNLRGVEKSYDDCFGVDLNRNFGYHWMKTGASDDICSDVYAGSEQNSEPEVKSIQNFIQSKNPHWLSFVSLHSYGGFWLHHWEKKNLQLTKKSYIRICNKPHIALRAIQKKHKYRYLFGIPSNLLSYDAAGASDTWAMMVSNITYAYTIEIGPTQEETMDDEYNYGYGFHVRETQIESIAERAYTGIREYLRSFIEHLTRKVQSEIDKKCSDDYDKLMRTFSGYWS